jgi:hypothetical protein
LEASFVSRTNNLLHITLHPFAMPNMEAKTVAKLLVEEVIVRFGTPYDM